MKKRVLYYDFLKVLGVISVVLIHVISEFWYDLDVTSMDFKILTFVDTLIRWAVPIYFMVSGALYLNDDKKIDIKKLFSKSILKIFLIFFFWNFVYTLLDFIIIKDNSLSLILFIKSIFNTMCGKGIYHLWFLVVIIGFYICVPVLKLITKKENKKVLEYLIMILFISTTLNTLIYPLFSIKISYPILFTGYIIYFILGYYMTTFEISKNKERIIYILGILSFFISFIGTTRYSIYIGKPSEIFLNYLSPNIIIFSISVFLFVKNKVKLKETKMLAELTRTYFGIYLIHGLVIGFYQMIGLFDIDITLSLLILFISVIIYLTCFLCVYIVLKIPVLRKFISL